MTAEQSGFETEVTGRTYQVDNLIFYPSALLSLLHTAVASVAGGSHTPLGLNILHFTPLLTPRCFLNSARVVEHMQFFSPDTF